MQLLQFDTIIIGGGAVGLACAVRLSKSHRNQVLLLEQHDRLGTETTSRNSEVIHAGIYYEKGSLKERLCIEGKQRLYEFCERHGVGYRRCGKLIVGTQSVDVAILEKIIENAKRNTVPIEMLQGEQVRTLEPRIYSDIAIHSPTTGIISSESYVQALTRLAEFQGVVIVCKSKVVSWERNRGQYVLHVNEPGNQTIRVESPIVVNSAGLEAFNIASPIFGAHPPFALKFVRGHYFSLHSKYKNVCSRLIYPIPDMKGGGLGIHLNLDLEGHASLGPDSDWRATESVDYSFHERDTQTRTEKFFQAARRYLPEIKIEDLRPSFVGVRPKRVDAQGKMLDFYIQNETDRGFSGWINLIGIESPGLTASLAIAEEVQRLVF